MRDLQARLGLLVILHLPGNVNSTPSNALDDFFRPPFRRWRVLRTAHSPSNETELSHRWRGRAVANVENCFIKSNVVITTASGWLERLVRCGSRYHAGGAVRLPLRINKTSDMANMSSPTGQTIRANSSAKKEISGTRIGCGRSATKSAK